MNINARQIEALDFNYLNQAETYQYNADQLARVKSSAAIMAKLQAEVAAWEASMQTFDVTYRKATTAGQTKVVENRDAERDKIYSGFVGTVNNALKSPIEAQQQAATTLQEPIKRYAISTGAEYQEQTMRTEQICQELLANYAPQLTALGLTAWVEALQAKNRDFKAAMTQRTNEQAGFVKSELANLRLQIISCYRAFVKLMNVVLIYEGDTAYASVIDQLNAEVRHYKQIIARKGGPVSASSYTGGSDTDSDTSDGGSSNTGSGTSGTGTGTGGTGSGSNESGSDSGNNGSSDDNGGGVGPGDDIIL
ncbi:MAG: hypothetical protein IJP70_02610 [Bacteroidales bacterium]|nr:hypothetical protein [Bacteroidales bacterium]